MSTGSGQDVTTVARWSSTTLACVVGASGVLTALDIGGCSVEALYSGVIGRATSHIGPSTTFTIDGTSATAGRSASR
ncbi:MAG: hypothetical protein ACM3SQ_11470 [Betaproteobacteria bacterium]